MARESALWDWLSAARDELGGDLHMSRVENLLESGWPDVEGCLLGGCFTIELKSKVRPARATTRLIGPGDVRPAQVPWLERRWSAGGSAFMLIQAGSGHGASRYLVRGGDCGLVVGATEATLGGLSVTRPRERAVEVVRRASRARIQ